MGRRLTELQKETLYIAADMIDDMAVKNLGLLFGYKNRVKALLQLSVDDNYVKAYKKGQKRPNDISIIQDLVSLCFSL